MELARFKLSILSPALAHKDRTSERAAALKAIIGTDVRFPDGDTRTLTRRTVYDWVKAYRLKGLHGLMRKPREDRKKKRVSVVKSWDDFFADRLDDVARDKVAEELTTYIRGLWGAGEPGWRSICDKSTTWLIELSDALCVDAFAAMPQGRPGDTMRGKAEPTRFAICNVTRRRAESERDYAIIAVKDRDNARYQDRIAPTIRRDYSALRPREIVVGDVHPVDVMMQRPDGTEVWPKAISWLDPSTNEIHMTFVLLEPGEGVRREHVAMSFEAMVEEWGLPSLLYLDNGSEYKWQEMVSGFTMLSKLVASSGQMKVFDLDADNEVAARVSTSREAVIRSLAYNAKGKPGIEGAFGNLEQVFFSTIKGWTAGDRMNKRTQQKGRTPIAFPGTAEDFLKQAGQALEWYHKRPQYGRLNGKSPNEALTDLINGGWGKTVLSSPEVLALAFSTEETRTPDRGAVNFTPRRGENLRYYADELLGYQRPITIRVPAYNPDYLFCFDDDQLICVARPEHLYHPLDPAGAKERGRRGKYLRRSITERRKHCALLSLVDETARHIEHLPDAPVVPIAAKVDAGILDRMAQIADRRSQRTNVMQPLRPSES